MRIKKKYLFLILGSISLSLAVPLLVGGLGQFKLLSRLSWWIASALALLVFTSLVCNAGRLRILLWVLGRDLSVREGTLMTISAQFAGLATPGAVGMPVTYTFLFKQMRLRFGEAMGLVAIISLTDILFYAALIPVTSISLLFGKLPSSVSHMILIVTILLVPFFLVLWLLPRNYRTMCRLLGRQTARFKWLEREKYRIGRTMVDFIRALRLIRRMSSKQQIGLFATTAGYWLSRLGVLVLIVPLLGGERAPVAYLFLIQALLNLGGQLMFLPGGGGGVDAGYVALMGAFLPPRALAFTLLIWRMFTYYIYLAVGAPVFVVKTGAAAQDLLSRRS